MPIRSNLLSWLFAHPQIAEHDIALTTPGRTGEHAPLHRAIRWWGQSPPDLPDGVSRRLLQDIGLDRSRS